MTKHPKSLPSRIEYIKIASFAQEILAEQDVTLLNALYLAYTGLFPTRDPDEPIYNNTMTLAINNMVMQMGFLAWNGRNINKVHDWERRPWVNRKSRMKKLNKYIKNNQG